MTTTPSEQTRISFIVPALPAADWLSTAMLELVEPVAVAATRFSIDGQWRVDGYFESGLEVDALVGQLAAVVPFEIPAPSIEEVPHENWVAISQAALPPVVVGRFTIHGSHDRARVPCGPSAIEIDAGEAFGTAHHATTEGCLKAIDVLTRRRAFSRVLDLGCGSGVLAIAARRVLPRALITAADIDPEAVRVAKDNARRNRARIDTRLADGFPRAQGYGRYDLIIANILAGPLIALAPQLSKRTVPGGVVVLSGILEHEAAQVIATYNAHRFTLRQHTRIAGWAALTLVRRGNLPRKAPQAA